jgi:hypothetical protein
MQAKTLVCWYLQTKTGLRLQAKLPFITPGENTEKKQKQYCSSNSDHACSSLVFSTAPKPPLHAAETLRSL